MRCDIRSVTQLCLTLCDPMDCSTTGFPFHHQLPELSQTHVHQVNDALQPSHPVVLFSSCLHSFPASESFPIVMQLSIKNSKEINGVQVNWLHENLSSSCHLDCILEISIEIHQDGEELRWLRKRMGRPLSPPQIHQKNI